MDIRHLERFLAVIDQGGFTAAADEMEVSQPALSQAIKELESELGIALFERLGRKVQVTSAGRALIEPARQALRDVETARAAVGAVAGLGAGTLSLGSLPTLAADPLAGLVGRFRSLHPGVAVDLAAPEDSSDLAAMIRDGRCEAGLTESLGVPEDLTSHEIGTQALLLILPPGLGGWGTPLGDEAVSPGAPVTVFLADLVEVPFVAAPVGTSTRRLLVEGFATAGAVPRIAVVTAQRDAILPLVLAGAGAALVPEPIATVARALGAAVARPVPVVERSIALIHRTTALAPAAARFVELATGAGVYGSAQGGAP
jgi:LysR family carnitine catabolism transcriptional activator